jgi:hypothetical protein
MSSETLVEWVVVDVDDSGGLQLGTVANVHSDFLMMTASAVQL